MNTVVIYFSKFGHTLLIARAIAETLEDASNVELLAHDELLSEHLSSADLVVMGTPTHRMNLPEIVRPIFKQLPRSILRGKVVAAFDTSYKMSDRNTPEWMARFTAAPKLLRKLRKLGGKPITAPETFYVKDREGPLYEGEIDRARGWAASILASLPSRSDLIVSRLSPAAK
jgi:flavodoxin